MLNVIVFVCGAALMSLELVAARVLAPALGNSIFVWGSVITTVMVALSLGYWLGGHVADRKRASAALAPIVAGAGVLTVLAPAIGVAVLPMAADLGPRAGSLVASALIFFAPALLLAMVSPLGVRLVASRGVERIGRSAGGLYAISTGGSIVGTLATSFWLIPLLSLEPLIIAIGFVLFATALAALALPSRYAQAVDDAAGVQLEAHAEAEAGGLPVPRTRFSAAECILAIALVVAGGLLGALVLAKTAPAAATNSHGERVLYRADTQYHRLTVTEADGVRHLRFDASNQSAIDMSDGFTSTIAYPNYMDVALALNPDAKRVLVLGLGGGAITKRWWRDYPDMTIDTVEIDPVVIEVAHRYFGLPSDPRLRIFNEDARRFVQTSAATYDIVLVDCYYSDSLPYHLTTQEFLGEVKERMAPRGVLAYNVIGSVAGEDSELFRSMYRTATGVWDHLWAFPIDFGTNPSTLSRRNIVVLATDTDTTAEELREAIRSRVSGKVKVAGFDGFGDDLYEGALPLSDVPVLTDSYAPTDSLIKVQ